MIQFYFTTKRHRTHLNIFNNVTQNSAIDQQSVHLFSGMNERQLSSA